MKGAITGKTPKANGLRTDWERLRRTSDKEIHARLKADPDAHPTDVAFWKNAKVVWPSRNDDPYILR